MEQLQNEEIKEDEISLLDLIVVIVKYRKLIIWGTILVSVLACMFLVILPNFDKDKDEYYIIDYNIPLYPNMNNFGNFISFDITEDVQTKINDRNFIAEINKKSLVFDYDFEAPSFNTLDYNQYIFNLFKDNYYVAKLSNTKSNILLSIKTKNQENADLFVNSLTDNINTEYREFLLPLIQKRINDIDKLLKQLSSDDKESREKLLNERLDLNELYNTTFDIIQKNRTKFVIREQGDSLLLKLIIVCFASFFLFIFLAFLLNAIKNIKCDKISNEKIKNAWNEGKKLFP